MSKFLHLPFMKEHAYAANSAELILAPFITQSARIAPIHLAWQQQANLLSVHKL